MNWDYENFLNFCAAVPLGVKTLTSRFPTDASWVPQLKVNVAAAAKRIKFSLACEIITMRLYYVRCKVILVVRSPKPRASERHRKSSSHAGKRTFLSS